MSDEKVPLPPPYPAQGYTVPVATPYGTQQVYVPPVQVQPLPVRPAWGDSPTNMVCVNCKTQQVSQPVKKVGIMSWIIVGVVAFILFSVAAWPCIPCAFLALLIDGFKDTEHVCPNCNYVNGVKKMA